MGTRCGLVVGSGGGCCQGLHGVVCQDEAEAGLVGAVVADGELERVVELALDRFRGFRDVHLLEDG
jgi:hypothetical protein